VLRGSYSAKIDDKGRLKLPLAFKVLVEERHGVSVYVTSLTGDSVRIYPMPVWQAIEERLSRVPSTNLSRAKYLDRVNYYGQAGEFDAQGRLSIHLRLREAAGITGEVDVLGQVDHLEVWNHDRFQAKLRDQPFTNDDSRQLSEFGI
jgi:MraZ protein